MFSLVNQNRRLASGGPRRTDVARGHNLSDTNRVWQSLATRPNVIQRKLAVSQADDLYEQEADRIANRVMRMERPASSKPQSNPVVSISSYFSHKAPRKCAPGEKDELQRKADGTNISALKEPASVVQRGLSSPGQPLDQSTRAFFEPRFGYDFSNVRVHTDGPAAESARAVNARAYTLGQHIVLGSSVDNAATNDGRQLLAHELVHVVQQGQALTTTEIDRSADQMTDGVTHQPQASRTVSGQAEIQRQVCPPRQTCTPLHPECCPLYEQWIQSLSTLPTFEAPDTVRRSSGYQYPVIGDRPARPGEEVWSGRRASQTGRYIDQPTEAWVTANLPPELRRVAYMLPCDCADMALVLRHVWLFYHNRSENYRNWRIGAGAAQLIAREIGQEVFTGSIARMVQAYTNDDGTPIRSFARLQFLLRPGDVIIVEHFHRADNRRAGDHTYVVESIRRSGGVVSQLILLQGNQPLMEEQARAIAPGNERLVTALRAAPGRRIERITLGSDALRDEAGVWTWGASAAPVYNQVARAGPPAAAPRPSPTGRGNVRRIADWLPVIRGAGRGRIEGVMESALLELRARAAGAGDCTPAEAEALGRVAGERVRALGDRALTIRIRAMISELERPGPIRRPVEPGTTRDEDQIRRMISSALFILLSMEFDQAVAPPR